jgi:hypothetical protein
VAAPTPAAAPIGNHWDFSQGRYVANNNATGAQFNPQAANALMMWYQSMGGNPNSPGQGDEGLSRFLSGVWQLDPEGGFSQVGFSSNARRPTHTLINSPEGIAAYNAWAMSLGRHADGTRIPGPASRADNILAWLSTGERVIPAERNIALERRFGFDWDRKLDVAMPRLASGGRIGSQSSDVGGQRGASGKPMKLIVVADAKAAAREAQSDPGYEVRVVDIINRNRHELALGAVE